MYTNMCRLRIKQLSMSDPFAYVKPQTAITKPVYGPFAYEQTQNVTETVSSLPECFHSYIVFILAFITCRIRILLVVCLEPIISRNGQL